jgi:AcrR family transcriptional regulator
MKRARSAVQEEIVRIAATCFGEMGYRATTLDTIAARAGLSKVTLYGYVGGKRQLLSLVFERTIASFESGLRQIVEQRLPADETLRRIVRYQVTLLASHLPFLTVFFSEEAGLPAAMAARATRAKRAYDRVIERVVRDGIAAGVFRDLPPTLVVFGILGMCNWLHTWYRPGGKNTADEIADVFVDLLERGYLARGTSRDEDITRALARIEARLGTAERGMRDARTGGHRTRHGRTGDGRRKKRRPGMVPRPR